jgi:tripartite-type tricarboxylate transporter receptor subunit TctC
MIRVIVQYAPTRSPELPDVPAVVEFGKGDEDAEVLKFYANSGLVGRSVVAPPGLPPDRVSMLRKAFAETLQDPEFLAEIKKLNLDLQPMMGAELQSLFASSTKTSNSVLARARAARAD